MNPKKILELSCTLSIDFVDFSLKKNKKSYFYFHASFFFFLIPFCFKLQAVQLCNWVGFRNPLSLSKEGAIFWDQIKNYFLALTWRDEIKIVIWPLFYYETRTRLHIVILVFRDEIESLEIHFEREKMKLTLIENSRDQEFSLNSTVHPLLNIFISFQMKREWHGSNLVRHCTNLFAS